MLDQVLASEKFHLLCMVLHLGTAGFMTSFAMSHKDESALSIYTWYDPILATFSLFILIILFSAITALFHFIYFIKIRLHHENENRYIRFIEYSITASIMIVLIGVLVGISDAFTLIAIGGLNSSVMWFGYIEEVLVKTNATKDMIVSPFSMGVVHYVVLWIILTWSFKHAIDYNGGEVPDFVTAIFIIEFIVFTSFALVQFYYVVLNHGPSSEEAKVTRMEAWYNVLSLTSKMFLAWMCFFGLKARWDE